MACEKGGVSPSYAEPIGGISFNLDHYTLFGQLREEARLWERVTVLNTKTNLYKPDLRKHAALRKTQGRFTLLEKAFALRAFWLQYGVSTNALLLFSS
jgi:hypothetical protein